MEDGFRAIKAAPFDGFPPLDGPAADVEAATELGIACIVAMRAAIGPDVDLKIDVHSFFDVPLAIEVAERLEPQTLSWYEEPVPPTDLESTRAIKDGISQTMAGGEFLFGVEGFAPLCRGRAVDIIMPDVKHCGGVAELGRIATVAELHDVLVSPHNPSGPVSTMVSASVCAGLSKLRHPGVPVERGALARRPGRTAGTLHRRDSAGARRAWIRDHAQRRTGPGTRLRPGRQRRKRTR